MRALVTGGGGFLGGAVIEQWLQRDGCSVRSFARGDYPELAQRGVEVSRGDLADPAAVCEAVRGCDIVFHVAAKAGIWGPAEDYEQANVVGTRNVLEACRQEGISRLVYTSSPSVAFHGGDMEGTAESAAPYPQKYLAHYPRTKAIAEQEVLAAHCDQFRTVALRPHLIWGPGDNHLVPRIVERARAGQLRIVGRGDRSVDSTYIDNAAHAHLCAADALERDADAGGRAYFISQGEPIPIADLINRILQAAQEPPVTRRIPTWLAYGAGAVLEVVYRLLNKTEEPRMTRFLARQLATAHWFDLSAARDRLGYEPRVSLEEGMARLERWLQSSSA